MGLSPAGGSGVGGAPATEGFDTMPAPQVRTFQPPAGGVGARRSLVGLRHRARQSPIGRAFGGRMGLLPTWGPPAGGEWAPVGWAWCFTSRKPLVPSSRGTTSLGSDGPTAGWTWCSAPRYPLFLRRRAPRLWGRMGLRQVGRGAPLPAIPSFFVAGHHVSRGGWASGKLGGTLPARCVLKSDA